MTGSQSLDARAGQAFFNFLDLMVKIETYPEVAERVLVMLEDLEKECLNDIENDPDSIVEMNWLLLVHSFNEFINSIIVEASGRSLADVIDINSIVKFKGNSDDSEN